MDYMICRNKEGVLHILLWHSDPALLLVFVD